MNKTTKLAIALCIAAGTAQSAFAAAQDLTSWTVSGISASFSSTTDATIFSGSGSSTSTAAFGGTGGTIMSKDFSLATTGTVTFDWYFGAGDYLPYNDFADVQIGSSLFALSSVGVVGNYGNSGWKSFSYSGALNGPISFVMSNANDNSYSSSLEVRNVQVSPVPESSNLALMLGGLGLLGVAMGRRSVR